MRQSKIPLVSIDVRQDYVERLLSALKVAESVYTSLGDFEAAQHASTININLRRQIYTYEKAPK